MIVILGKSSQKNRGDSGLPPVVADLHAVTVQIFSRQKINKGVKYDTKRITLYA